MALMLLSYLLWIPALVGWGWALARVLRAEAPLLSVDEPAGIAAAGMLGLVAAIGVGFAVNFLAGLSPLVSALFLAAGWALFARGGWRAFALRPRGDFVFYGLFLVLISYAAGGTVFHYDTGLYHYQAVAWIASGPPPLGLANLHTRFGFNSAWWAAAAMLELPGARGHAVQILNPLLAFFMGTAVYAALRRAARAELSVAGLLLALAAFPLAYRGAGSIDLNSLSTDFPSGCLMLLVCYLLLRSREAPGGAALLRIALALAAAGAMIKMSLAVPAAALWAIALLQFFRRTPALTDAPREHALTPRLVAFISALTLLWAARGVMISGAVFHPSRVIYLGSLPWAVPADRLDAYALLLRNWARSPGWTNGAPWVPWEWVGPWARALVIEETLLLAAIAVSGALMLALGPGGAKTAFARSGIGPALIPPLGGFAFWLVSVPDFRYGWPFAYAAALLIFAAGAAAWGERWRPPRIRAALLSSFLLALAAGLGLKLAGLHRSPQGWAWNIQRPPLASWPPLPEAEVEERSIDGMTVRIPKVGDQCWTAPLPCAAALDPCLRVETNASGRPIKFWCEETPEGR